jgi:hypothetical protein
MAKNIVKKSRYTEIRNTDKNFQIKITQATTRNEVWALWCAWRKAINQIGISLKKGAYIPTEVASFQDRQNGVSIIVHLKKIGHWLYADEEGRIYQHGLVPRDGYESVRNCAAAALCGTDKEWGKNCYCWVDEIQSFSDEETYKIFFGEERTKFARAYHCKKLQ